MKKEIALLIIIFVIGLIAWSQISRANSPKINSRVVGIANGKDGVNIGLTINPSTNEQGEKVDRYCSVDIFPVVIYQDKKQCPQMNQVLVGVDWHKEQIACGTIRVSCWGE